MYNQGLKKQATNYSRKVGQAGTVHINLNKNCKNTILEIPLFQTLGLNQIELSLIYNHQAKNTNVGLGNGFKINYYNKFLQHDYQTFRIDTADSSFDLYSAMNNYYSPKTKLQIVGESTGYKLKDRFGNYMQYASLNQEYPNLIHYKDGNEITINATSNLIINNNKGDEILFINSNGENIIAHYMNNEIVYIVKLTVDTDGNLTNIELQKNGQIINNIEITYSNTYLKLKDTINDVYGKVIFTNENEINYEYSDLSPFRKVFTDKIEYSTFETKVIYNNNKKTNYVFDGEFLEYEIDNDGYLIEREYNDISYDITSESRPIKFNDSNNIIPNWSELCNVCLADYRLAEPIVICNDYSVSDVYTFSVNNEYTYHVTLEREGIATDNLMLSFWSKQTRNATTNNYIDAKLELLDSNNNIVDYTKMRLNHQVYDRKYDFNVLGVTASKSYSKIRFTLYVHGENLFYIGGLQLFEKPFGSFYQYDENGNVVEYHQMNSVKKKTFNSNNELVSTTSNSGNSVNYKYDSLGRLIEKRNQYDVVTNVTYDNNSNITKQTITSHDNKVLEVNNQYSTDGIHLTKSIDELGKQTSYQTDDINNVYTTTTPILETITKTLNKYGMLSRYDYSKAATTIYNIVGYDSKNRLSVITTNSGLRYNVIYMTADNSIHINLYDNPLFVLRYDENMKLIKEEKGSFNKTYTYLASDNDYIEEVIYKTNNTEDFRFKYEYNNLKQIRKVLLNNVVIKEYQYDIDDRLIESKITVDNMTNTIDYKYDNLGNVISEKKQAMVNTVCNSYEPVNRSLSTNPCDLRNTEVFKKVFVGFYDKNNSLVNADDTMFLYDQNNNTINYATYYTDNLTVLKSSSSVYYNYSTSLGKPDGLDCGFVGYWFKPSEIVAKRYLFTTSAKTNSSYIGVYILNGKVCLEITDKNGVVRDKIIESKNTLIANEWNFFSLSFMNKINESNLRVSEYSINLNGINTCISITMGFEINIDGQMYYSIAHKHKANNRTDALSWDITMVMMTNRSYLSYEDVDKLYKLTSDYINDIKYKDNTLKTRLFSQTNMLSLNNTKIKDYDLFLLQNSITSFNGTKPLRFSLRNTDSSDKDKTFNYNHVSKRYALVCDGNELVYDFNQTNQGTIFLKAFSKMTLEEQYILELLNDSKNIGLIIDKNNKLNLKINNIKYTSSLIFNKGSWNNIAISFNNSSTDSSKLSVLLYCNGNTYGFNIDKPINNESFKVSIGRKCNSIVSNKNMGKLEETYPLYGQVEMLCAKGSVATISELDSLSNTSLTTKTKEYDDLNMLYKTSIKENDVEVLRNKYEYCKKTSSSNRISKSISTEEIFNNGVSLTKRYYSYDNSYRLIKVEDPVFGYNSYQYNDLGMIKADFDYSYEYDQYGNLTKIGDKILTYNKNNNKLLSVGGKSITYEGFYPKTYDGATYTFKYNNLASYVKNGLTISFEYDENNLRRKKIINGVTTKYYYDSRGNLISQEGDQLFDFLYDEHNQLYGFILNNSTKYYYVRDAFQNILGICGQNGELVVKYRYSSFGQLLEVSGTNVALGNLNPFIYKGYYYDTETQMYYCKGRYYNPEWCRWISPDTFDNIDCESVNGLNLYAYCENNPIMAFDPTGSFMLGAMLVSIGLSVVSEVIEDVFDGGGMNHDPLDYVGAAVSGFFDGLTPGGSRVSRIFTGVVFDTAGAILDAAISGELKEEGTLVDIVIDVGVSALANQFRIDEISKKINANRKSKKLLKMKKSVANKKLKEMGIGINIGSKKAENALKTIIAEQENLLSNQVAEVLGNHIFSYISYFGKLL